PQWLVLRINPRIVGAWPVARKTECFPVDPIHSGFVYFAYKFQDSGGLELAHVRGNAERKPVHSTAQFDRAALAHPSVDGSSNVAERDAELVGRLIHANAERKHLNLGVSRHRASPPE